MAVTLAVKYRPKTFDDVSEQTAIKTIITNQIKNNDLRNAYLFCGGAGTGKTTCARIVADMINDGQGNPIELDAASNNSVDDVRNIITDSKFKALDAKYKIYIIDECHMLSNAAWNAMLKLLEEPPKSTIFIFCTTDVHKIPDTIMSRVQRYNFQRISHDGIVKRLEYILNQEFYSGEGDWTTCDVKWDKESLDYIAKLATGGMRDAITMLDKCMAYGSILLPNVVKVLSGGVTPYDLADLTQAIYKKDLDKALSLLDSFFMSGIDMMLLMKMYFEFLLNLSKYLLLKKEEVCNIPSDILGNLKNMDAETIRQYNMTLYTIINGPKMDAKVMMEAWVINRCI